MARFQRISPCLCFNKEAEDAAKFYVSVFSNSKIIQIAHYGELGQEIHGQPAGSVATVLFELDGQEFTALNGGPHFKFSEGLSLQIYCETQAEIDHFWSKLTAEGGEPGPCGWLKDQFGLSWQVVPAMLPDMLSDPDRDKAQRVMNAVWHMGKIDIAQIRQAYEGA